MYLLCLVAQTAHRQLVAASVPTVNVFPNNVVLGALSEIDDFHAAAAQRVTFVESGAHGNGIVELLKGREKSRLGLIRAAENRRSGQCPQSPRKTGVYGNKIIFYHKIHRLVIIIQSFAAGRTVRYPP